MTNCQNDGKRGAQSTTYSERDLKADSHLFAKFSPEVCVAAIVADVEANLQFVGVVPARGVWGRNRGGGKTGLKNQNVFTSPKSEVVELITSIYLSPINERCDRGFCSFPIKGEGSRSSATSLTQSAPEIPSSPPNTAILLPTSRRRYNARTPDDIGLSVCPSGRILLVLLSTKHPSAVYGRSTAMVSG